MPGATRHEATGDWRLAKREKQRRSRENLKARSKPIPEETPKNMEMIEEGVNGYR
jgi:hypothetical protein